MAVICLQSIDGEEQPIIVIEPHSPEQTDMELLLAKAAGAADKGWLVDWLADDRFEARKVRWQESALCSRLFWIE